MQTGIFFALVTAGSVALGACGNGSAPNRAGTMAFIPPNQTFAQGLGITGGPISSEQANTTLLDKSGGGGV